MAVFGAVQPAQAQGKGYYKHKDHDDRRYERRGNYGYRHDRDDDDDQGGRRRYYRGNDYGYYRSLPPGQAKKIYGYKSAKYFAPGQQKKRYRYEDNRYYNQGYYQSNTLTNVLGSLLGY